MRKRLLTLLWILTGFVGMAQTDPTPQQLERWLQRFPEADTNEDGRLTEAEANAYRNQRPTRDSNPNRAGKNDGVPRTFSADPGWKADRFPEHAISYRTPAEIKAVYESVMKDKGPVVTTFPKPADGSLRIVGTGHSFMRPGYTTLPWILEAAGYQSLLLTHTGGGVTGSARYKWEQENGIFEYDGKPLPKLLASIANADWEIMMWGPYINDRPEYYLCWINFCRKYHPGMRFYLSDAWPQLYQLGETPETETELTDSVFNRMGDEKREVYSNLIKELREASVPEVYIMPTSDAMLLAALWYLKDELPGVQGINTIIGGQKHSLWRDKLGHLGPGFERLEGYVFYSTLHRRSAELIERPIKFSGDDDYPSPELDRIFRKIAWQAVIGHPFSGVRDANGDGLGD